MSNGVKKKRKNFLKLPEFPGGKEAFRKYIKENQVYPKEAQQKEIEGVVHLNAEIDDNGQVLNVSIEKSVGAGCDEEAVRLIKNVQFGKVKNRGKRVKIRRKFKIEFKLPPNRKINYSITENKNKKVDKNDRNKYSYSIKL